jgi:hypothetical protein
MIQFLPSFANLTPAIASLFYLVLLIFAIAKRNRYHERASRWLLIYLFMCLSWSVVEALTQLGPAWLSAEVSGRTGLLLVTVFRLVLTRSALSDTRPSI